MINKLHIPIKELVEADPKMGFVLHTQGIKFYEHADSTVAAVSARRAFNLQQFIRQADWQYQYQLMGDPLKLNRYNALQVIDYLSFMHRMFVKEKLPYFSALIEDFHNVPEDKRISDLKWAFPYFLEDFVHHILEEEEQLFQYVRRLLESRRRQQVSSALLMEMEKCSIKEYSLHHLLDDDEMSGIRSLTNDYSYEAADSLERRVLFFELREFEKELHFHARIENEVLFPKALSLEQGVRDLIRKRKHSN